MYHSLSMSWRHWPLDKKMALCHFFATFSKLAWFSPALPIIRNAESNRTVGGLSRSNPRESAQPRYSKSSFRLVRASVECIPLSRCLNRCCALYAAGQVACGCGTCYAATKFRMWVRPGDRRATTMCCRRRRVVNLSARGRSWLCKLPCREPAKWRFRATECAQPRLDRRKQDHAGF